MIGGGDKGNHYEPFVTVINICFGTVSTNLSDKIGQKQVEQKQVEMFEMSNHQFPSFPRI